MILLAAGQGTRLRPLTDDRPKCMVPLNGRPLLDWQIDVARAAGIDEIIIVGGYRADWLKRPECKLVINERFDETNMVESLMCARDYFTDGFIVSYGDIVFERSVLESLLAAKRPTNIVVDREWRSYWESRFENPLEDAESLTIDQDGTITSIGQDATSLSEIQAQYIGLMSFKETGVEALLESYQLARKQSEQGQNPFGGPRSLDGLYMTDLLQGMVDQGHQLWPTEIRRGWFEIDNPTDLAFAQLRWTGEAAIRAAG